MFSRREKIMAAVGGLALLLAVTPFVLLRVVGPGRFEDVKLGETPDGVGVTGSMQTYLIFSTGSSGVSRADAERLRVNDLGDRGADKLTDTIIVLVTDSATHTAAMLSIPRDTWMFDRGHRINATFAIEGLQAFVDDVSATTGLPIHHLVQLNFVAFGNLVDGIGGIAVEVDRPLADLFSVLYVPSAGCWRFSGADALAYARSRHTLTQRSSGWSSDRTASDFGRAERQRALAGAAWDQIRGPQIVTRIPALLDVAADGLVIDKGLGPNEMIDLARAFSGLAGGGVEGYTLPTTGRRIRGAAAQVVVDELAAPILARLRAWPPADAGPRADPSPTSDAVPDTSSPSPSSTPDDQPVPGITPSFIGSQPDGCTVDRAQDVPDPRPALAKLARSRPRSEGGTVPDRPDPTADPSATPSSGGSPTGEPSPEPSPTPSPEPSPSGLPFPIPTDPPVGSPQPSPQPSPSSSPSPSPSSSPDPTPTSDPSPSPSPSPSSSSSAGSPTSRRS